MRTKLLLLTLITLTVFACNKPSFHEEIGKDFVFNYESTTEEIEINAWSAEKGRIISDSIAVQSVVAASKNIPEQFRTDEGKLKEYLIENEVRGKLAYFINGEISHEVNFDVADVINTNSESINQRIIYDSGDCSFRGVQDCLQEEITDQGIVSSIVCAFTFYACAGAIAGDCTLTNCTDLQ